jgi:hypothetical protein
MGSKSVVHGGFMSEMGKMFVVLGVALVVVGLALTLLGRWNLPLGRLPGDILYRGKRTTFYFPLATSVVVSVVLSVVMYLVGRWRR